MDHDRDDYFEKYGDRLSKHGITLYVNGNEEGTEVYSLSARNSEGNLIEGMDNEPFKSSVSYVKTKYIR